MAKILYVDADCRRVQAVCALMSARGHRVTVAGCAERAMIRVDQESDFDAVVLHLILPGIDGAELCRWLQRRSALAAVPRVVFTEPEVHLELDLSKKLPRWLPADVYIHGLADPAILIEAVEKVLCHQESRPRVSEEDS